MPEGLTGGKIPNYFEHLLEPSIAHVPSEGWTGYAPLESVEQLEHIISTAQQPHLQASEDHGLEWTLTIVSVIIALAGLAIGWVWFNRKPLWQPPRLLEEKYYVDEVYDAAIVQPIKTGSTRVLWKFIDVGIIDGAVNGAGQLASMFGGAIRYLQSGLARGYVAIVVLGALLIIGYFVIK